MASGQPYDYVGTVWTFGERAGLSAGSANYLAAAGGTKLPSELAVVATHAGTLKDLRWNSAASTLSGSGHKVTLYVNGAATPLVATWNGAAKSGTGTASFIAIAPGDTLSIRVQLAAGTGTITRLRVSVAQEMPSAIPWKSNGADTYYDAGGNIGIGTDVPGDALSVNGTIGSMAGGFRFPDGSVQTTAFGGPQTLTPAGAVIAFAGVTVPAGWLLCDGSAVDRATYSDLFAAIGTAHGWGDQTTTFNLPNYRGLFLRGVGPPLDPDGPTRMAPAPGGNTGYAVGSIQLDQLAIHHHTMGVGGADSFSMVQGGATERLAHFADDMFNGGPAKETHYWGGTESRPKNAYVYFLIKT